MTSIGISATAISSIEIIITFLNYIISYFTINAIDKLLKLRYD